MEAERLLIVNADQFGRSSGINRGVIEGHRRGIVTSASAMVRRPGASEAARLSREHPGLSVGLHLDLCEWERRDGEWHLVESVVPLDDGDQVAEEILYQLACFRALFCRDPTHLDSHQDVHRSDPTRSLLLTVARKLGIPLRHFASEIHVRSTSGNGSPTADDSAGGISADRLRALLAELPPGCTELVCRPGLDAGGNGSRARERERELKALCDPEVRRAIEEHGIRRVSFHELGGGRREDAEGRQPGLRERGRTAYDRKDFHQAAFWFRRETSVSPDRPWPWLWLSRAQLRTGDLVGSRASVDRALDNCPDWPPALLHLADLHLELDRHDAAADVLERLVLGGANGSGGTAVGARIARGVARRVHRLQDSSAALRVARALARHHPDQDSAVAAKAISLWRDGRGPDPEALDTPVRGRSARAAAEIELEMGNARKAWNLIRTAPLVEEDRELVTRIAHALRRRGDLTGAWEALERTMALGATDAVIGHWRDVVLGEVHVLSGVWAPPAPRTGAYEPFPTRVLHVVDRSAPPAKDSDALRLQERMLAQKEGGLDPQVAARVGFPADRSRPDRERVVDVDGIPHHRIDGPDADGLPARLDQRLELNARELGALVRRVRPAVLHAGSDFRSALVALAVRRACGVPVVYEVQDLPAELWRTRGSDDERQPLALRWRLARELDCMRAADRVITPGESIRDALVERGVPEEKIAVVPNAADVHTFRPGPVDRELARSLGLLPGQVVVGGVAGPRRDPPLELVVEALSRFVHEGQPVKGLFIGDREGPALRRVEERARDLGIGDEVVLAGSVSRDRLVDHYRLIDVFVEARRFAGDCPAAAPPELFEAMAAERAVVVSGVESYRETVLPGVTGFVADTDDPDDLVRVLAPLVGSQELRAGMGRAARQWVIAHRSWEQDAKRCAELYGSLRMPARREEEEWWKVHAAAAFRVGPGPVEFRRGTHARPVPARRRGGPRVPARPTATRHGSAGGNEEAGA